MTKIVGRRVDYAHDDAPLIGYFSVNESLAGPRPAVLIIHDAFGVGPFMKAKADQLAALGYAAFAADLWGEGRILREESEIGPMIGSFAADRGKWHDRLRLALATLKGQPEVDGRKIAAIGYCFGGASVLELARIGADLSGVVSFHAGLKLVGLDWTPGQTRAKILITTGYDDPSAEPAPLNELLAALNRAGAHWEADLYGGVKHGFTNPFADKAGKPECLAYSAEADARSWNGATHFFGEIFAS